MTSRQRNITDTAIVSLLLAVAALTLHYLYRLLVAH